MRHLAGLLIAASAIGAHAADFDIRDFGAVEGGEEMCSGAFAAAIEKCASSGGGRVVVPDGEWLTGPIHFRSNVELHLSDDAKIVFSGDPADCLPAVQTTWEGLECMNYSPLVYAFGCTNVAITGRGTLAPRMEVWREWFRQKPAHFAAMSKLYHMAATNTPVEVRRMVDLPDSNMRSPFVQFNRCKGIRLEGFKIRESPMWCLHILLSEDVVVRNLDVYAHGFNNDGIDIDATRNVLIEDCTFDQGDDAIVIKALRNHDGWRNGKATENVVIRRCRVNEGHALLAVGSEISGGIRNVTIEDCEMSGCARNLIYLKTNRRRGGFIENITARRIKADKVESTVAIDTDILYHWTPKRGFPDYEIRFTPIRGLTVEDVSVDEAEYAVRIAGDANLPIEDVTVRNLRVGKVTKEAISVKNAKNVKLELE